MDMRLARLQNQSSSGLVVEYIVAIDVTGARFPAAALAIDICKSIGGQTLYVARDTHTHTHTHTTT